ncbi:tetratricopeptide repeat protein [uncultured Thalassospira sp.]|uniref:tetratricopeptide repeat protein n=1 Tax=uncultured Thalassospira sp. TaxID=404382 RepID=UPI0025935317|nr:tetratricopeptide repeat protein [uncultured Thalassospira sp.]
MRPSALNLVRRLMIAALIGVSFAAIPHPGQARQMSRDYQTGYYAYRSGDFEQAHDYWRSAAQKDDPYAQYALGLLYYRGDLGQPDYQNAAKWFKKAARANHGGAIYYIGLLYFNGHGLHYDQFRATEYFKRALKTDPENGDAAYLIGAQYFHGRGARQNFIEAAHYFEIGAKANNHAAQFMYGALLERGWGVPQNLADAYYWLRRSANGPMTFPEGANEAEPLDPQSAIDALEPRLSIDEIQQVEKRLAGEVPW